MNELNEKNLVTVGLMTINKDKKPIYKEYKVDKAMTEDKEFMDGVLVTMIFDFKDAEKALKRKCLYEDLAKEFTLIEGTQCLISLWSDTEVAAPDCDSVVLQMHPNWAVTGKKV